MTEDKKLCRRNNCENWAEEGKPFCKECYDKIFLVPNIEQFRDVVEDDIGNKIEMFVIPVKEKCVELDKALEEKIINKVVEKAKANHLNGGDAWLVATDTIQKLKEAVPFVEKPNEIFIYKKSSEKISFKKEPCIKKAGMVKKT